MDGSYSSSQKLKGVIMEKIMSQLFVESDKIDWEIVGEGVKRKILGYDDQLMMVVVQFDKGSIGYVHKHPQRQTTYLVKGKFEVQIGNKMKILKEGDCYYIPPNVEHGVVCLEEGILIDVFNPHREDFLKQ
jgi:quercetin dioxygenase-like cupin family protein